MNNVMKKYRVGFFASACILIVAGDAWAQAGPNQDRRGDGRPGGREGRGWFRDFNVQDQSQMYDRMVDRYLERFTRRYELNESQQQQVKAHLEQLKAQQEAYAAPLRDEVRDLIEEARELRRARRAGEEVDNERSREIWRRFSEIRRGSPLMDFRNVTSEVETMLPAEQVQKGRERDDRPGFQRRGPEDRWRRYLERFSSRYQLDESQRATAESVFRNLSEQRDRYRQAHKMEYAALDQIQSREERQARQRELNQPIEDMFDQLQSKLDQIPTAAQKAAAPPEPERRRPRAQTQPATTG